MSDSTSRISRGLDARGKQIAPDPLAALKRAPKNIQTLKQIAVQAVAARDSMSTYSAAILFDLKTFREAKAAELAGMGKMTVDGMTTDTLGDGKRKSLLEAAVRERAQMARQTSAAERLAVRKELAGMREAVNAARESFTNPVAVLHRKTLDSDRRATIAANLDRQGPRGVQEAMRSALASGDLELAAAALDRFDHLSKSEREFIDLPKSNFARALVGDDIAVAERALLVFEIAADEADLLNAEAEGKDVSRMRLAIGLKKRDLKDLPPEPEATATPSTPQPGQTSESEPDVDLPEDFPEAPDGISNRKWKEMIEASLVTEERVT